MTVMAFLEIDHLVKRFGPVEVLKGIDLSVEEGGFLVLVGPSGCGKSTLLSMIAGLDTVSAGEIRIAGRRVQDRPCCFNKQIPPLCCRKMSMVHRSKRR